MWIFGDLWCSAWLAVDVWMCTASILNLCAISLDRYVAVTRPVTYPSIMSARRARWLIAAVWVLSFVICFPPLVGWKDTRMTDYYSGNTKSYFHVTGFLASTPVYKELLPLSFDLLLLVGKHWLPLCTPKLLFSFAY